MDNTKGKQDFCVSTLKRFGANDSQIEELLVYNENHFDFSALSCDITFPMEDEPHVYFWEHIAQHTDRTIMFSTLRQFLVQLNFPIKQGISKTVEYLEATGKGHITNTLLKSQGLPLSKPESIELIVHQAQAGKIPILITAERDDFVALFRALTCKNEPVDIPESQGAVMISGYNNWGRIREQKELFRKKTGIFYTEKRWAEKLRKIIPVKHLYQDKLILLTRGCYSGIKADRVGLDSELWQSTSLIIRRDHECFHYMTKRIFSSMHNNVLDEFLADFSGIVAASGKFNQDWFLLFMGLENFPAYRDGGRLQNYRNNPPLSDGAFAILQKLLYHAVLQVAKFCSTNPITSLSCAKKSKFLLALMHFRLEEMSTSAFQEQMKFRLAQL